MFFVTDIMAFVRAPVTKPNFLQRQLFVGIHLGSVSYVKNVLDQNQVNVNEFFPTIDILEFVLKEYNYKEYEHLSLSPLSVAASFHHYQICDLLLQAGADINLPSKQGYLSLNVAIKCLRRKIIYYYLSYSDATLLHLVSYEHDTELLEYLLNNGGDVKAMDENEDTPLHWAVTKFNGKNVLCTVQHLVESGADVNALDIYKQTPIFVDRRREKSQGLIHMDSETKQKETACQIVQYFHEHGTNFFVTDYRGNPVLHHLLTNKDLIFFEAMKSYCNIRQPGKFGGNLVCWFPVPEEMDMISLLDADDVNNTDIYGETALYRAAFCGNVKAVIQLIHLGADVNIMNKFGFTPLASTSSHQV